MNVSKILQNDEHTRIFFKQQANILTKFIDCIDVRTKVSFYA